jgi:hypothetical protein
MTITETTTKETLLSQLPSYIMNKLNTVRDEWKATELECHAQGDMEYNADARMKEMLEQALKNSNVNRALQHLGNYSWQDSYLRIAGKGLFINAEFKKELTNRALAAIETWMNTILI